jgi:hypothetical protein
MRHPQVRRQTSQEYFSVDGMLIDALASLKSFRPKGERGSDERGGGSDGGGRNAERDWRGERDGRSIPRTQSRRGEDT